MSQLFIFCKSLSLHFNVCNDRWQQQSAIKLLFHLLLPGACLVMVLNGCASYKIPTQALAIHVESNCHLEEDCIQQKALDHWLYHLVPRHRCQIQWYDVGHTFTWMLFGNDDDGVFGEGPCAHYRPCQNPSFGKAICWGVRNPLHNFCFYVIGSADRQNSEIDLVRITPWGISGFNYRPQGDTVFASGCSSFYLGLHGCKPFISLRLAYSPKYSFDFYLGWRCRGNFGLKFLPLKKRD